MGKGNQVGLLWTDRADTLGDRRGRGTDEDKASGEGIGMKILSSCGLSAEKWGR